MSVKLSDSTAATLFRHLRREWASGSCTAELDAAMRVLDGQLNPQALRTDLTLRERVERAQRMLR